MVPPKSIGLRRESNLRKIWKSYKIFFQCIQKWVYLLWFRNGRKLFLLDPK